MKRICILSLLLLLVACTPIRSGIEVGSNVAFCDATFVVNDTGLFFDPGGVVFDVYFTVSGVIDSSDLVPVQSKPGLWDKLFKGAVSTEIQLEVSGTGVAIVSYLREAAPRVCIAVN